MKFSTTVGISVGILAGLWTIGSSLAGLITYAGFLSWASFYAAGGKAEGLKTTLILNFSGVIWGAIIVGISGLLGPVIGPTAGLGAGVAVGAAGMCWQGKISWLGFIPGAFVGCSTYFAAGFDFTGSVIGLVFGAVLGYLSEQGGHLLEKKDEKNTVNTTAKEA
ncbi:DUF1097 domain-containing protein [Salibacterium qingdaonense]|uniref:DUF1097 domain-containing protein n=1 Tax=Salibacterium qingdaonense TaxID=266892 RepID=A0A1I4PPI2_9BACI|nr:DUF1097 domain-containing protein [Salibacterium qingdaonense]SFM29285.1 Protein of unknown function [Salibacterium qingdaonense]